MKYLEKEKPHNTWEILLLGKLIEESYSVELIEESYSGETYPGNLQLRTYHWWIRETYHDIKQVMKLTYKKFSNLVG